MSKPYIRCDCPECEERPVHTIVQARTSDGESLALRVPWAHRWTEVGWHGREHVRFGGLAGLELDSGENGITAVDATGRRHRVPHGRFTRHAPHVLAKALVSLLVKGIPLKAGQKWVTIHPGGNDEGKGVPVLIQENPDGTARIIAGAGGKLTHLRLREPATTETPEQKKAKIAERRKKKAAKEKARKEGQTAEQAATEGEVTTTAKEKRLAAERKFVEAVRAKAGGVSEDLDPATLGDISEGARRKVLSQHHRKQVREAIARKNELAVEVARQHAEAEKEKARQGIEPPSEAALAVAADMKEDAQQAEEQAAARMAKRGVMRAPGGDLDEKAIAKTIDTIKARPDPARQLEGIGGRDDDPGKILREPLTPSVEVSRRALQHVQDAQALLAASEGQDVSGAPGKVVERALREAGVEAGSEEAKAVLQKEAARVMRRSELEEARSKRLQKVENEDGIEAAKGQLAFTDAMKKINSDAKDARDRGLTDAAHVPVVAPEEAALMDLLQVGSEMRAAKKEEEKVKAAVQAGDYDKSRRAFDLNVAPATDADAAKVANEVGRQLTEQLLGVANPRKTEHQMAVSAGHYDSMADVGLSIAGQRYIDRITMDAVGPKNAAVLMRYAMEQDGFDSADVRGALESYHVEQVVKASASALARADEYVPGLTAKVAEVGDIEAAAKTLDAHEQDLADVQSAVGSAIGRLEGTATMGQVFRDKMPSVLTVEAGPSGMDSSLRYLHSLGLSPSDYSIDHKEHQIKIGQAAWPKLIQRASAEEMGRRQEADAIKSGLRDETGWLPPGIVSRAATTFTAPTPEQPRYREALDTSKGLRKGLEEHVGSRLADGEAPHDIHADLMSAVNVSAAKDPEAYTAEIRRLFPLVDAEGRTTKLSDQAAQFNGLAERYMDGRYGKGAGPYHAQDIGVDSAETHEAVFRTLAKHPEAVVAFKPTGQLTSQDQRAIRGEFFAKMGIDPKQPPDENASYQDAMKALGEEPSTRQAGLMFGGGDGGGSESEYNAKVAAFQKEYRKGYDQTVKGYKERNPDATAAQVLRDVGSPPRPTHDEIVAKLGKPPNPEDASVMEWRQRRDAVEALRAGEISLPEALHALGPKPPDTGSMFGNRALEEHEKLSLAMRKIAASNPSRAWSSYVMAHGSQEMAYKALQEEMKGRFVETFTGEHGRMTGRGLVTGIAEVPQREVHVRATASVEDALALAAKRKSEIAGVQKRGEHGFSEMGGKGSAVAAHNRALEQETIDSQMQGMLFGAAPTAKKAEVAPKRETLEPGERRSIGERAENQIASLVNGPLGRQFEPGKPIGLFAGLNMDGSRVHQQRVIRQLDATKRVGAFLGTGSGKSLVSIGAFTQAHDKGEAKHGLYLVPSAVAQQFGGEMLRYTEPGKYRWDTSEGKKHAERVAMLKDPGLHMRVMTHQSFRDTALRIMADHQGIDPNEMGRKLTRATPNDRARMMREAFDAAGIPKQFVYYDEAHTATARGGGDPSLSHVIATAVTHPDNATHLLLGTATPTKNDATEMQSWAAMLDPKRYSDRSSFMASFGQNPENNPNAIRKEMSPLTYTARVDPEGVDRIDVDNPRIEQGPGGLFGSSGTRKVGHGGALQLLPEHQKAVDAVDAAYTRARNARDRGEVDLEAMRVLSPNGYKGMSDDDARRLAARQVEALGVMKESALRRAINMAPAEHNTKLRAMAAVIKHDLGQKWTDRKGKDRKGKAAVVFTDRLQEARIIHDHLRSQGVRVALYHGGLSPQEKEAIRTGFHPEGGAAPAYDVVIGTASMEAGVNMQRASVIHHFDVPMTEKSHAQRTGRAYRQGQLGDVDVHNWYTDHDFETRALRRLHRKEGLAAVFQTPLGSSDENGVGSHYNAIIARKHQAALPQVA